MDIAAEEQINELVKQRTQLEQKIAHLRAEYKRAAEAIQKQVDDIDQRLEAAKSKP